MRRVFLAPDFFARERRVFAGRVDLIARFAAGTAARMVLTAAVAWPAAFFAVRLTLGMTGLPLAAAFPSAAPITPPTTAPIGPPSAPTTAPVAAPAAGFGMGGISMFSFEPDCEEDSGLSSVDCDSFAMK